MKVIDKKMRINKPKSIKNYFKIQIDYLKVNVPKSMTQHQESHIFTGSCSPTCLLAGRRMVI